MATVVEMGTDIQQENELISVKLGELLWIEVKNYSSSMPISALVGTFLVSRGSPTQNSKVKVHGACNIKALVDCGNGTTIRVKKEDLLPW